MATTRDPHRRSPCWVVPLGDLRAAVPRRDDQLHRPAGDRPAQADAAGHVSLVRDGLRGHRVRVPARVRDRVRNCRPRDRSAGHARRVRRRDRRLERRGGRTRDRAGGRAGDRAACWGFSDSAIPRRSPVSWARARCSGSAKPATSRRRSRRWPSGFRSANARCAPASSTRARTSARSSRRSSCRGSRVAYGWAWAFLATGALGFLWLVALARAVSTARSASAAVVRRARLHPQRSGGCARARAVAAALPVPADVGVCGGEVPHRSGVVAVPLLDSGFPQSHVRPRPQEPGTAARRDLSGR